ncbi:MAG: YdcF family protein [Rhodospirillaceae bacterium]|nr:MAG: YdcF family protein [Rhodospirillaceae bacterium]
MIGKIFAWGVGGLVAAATAWAVGLIWFAATIPSTVADTTSHTDAIVVLTGGSERIETGLKLLTDGLADRLYVSGIGGQLRHGDLLGIAVSDPVLGPRIALGTAANTPGNAAETAAWARAAQVRSIRLVTAGYHMRRSLLELSAAMPEVRIIPHPVFPPHVKTDWWRWPGTTSLIAREYTKFVLTWLWQSMGIDAEIPTTRFVASPAPARETPPPDASTVPAAP